LGACSEDQVSCSIKQFLEALSREMAMFAPPLPHDKRKLVLHFLTTIQEE